jgi:hypothetical protein
MSKATDAQPPAIGGRAGGTYAQGDMSEAARRSKLRETRAGEPNVPGAAKTPRKTS